MLVAMPLQRIALNHPMSRSKEPNLQTRACQALNPVKELQTLNHRIKYHPWMNQSKLTWICRTFTRWLPKSLPRRHSKLPEETVKAETLPLRAFY